jgi:hypothetical protein
MADASLGSPRHLYRDDVGVEMTTIDDDEDDEVEEGQLMLGEGSKTEPVQRSRCKKCPYVLLVLILFTVLGVGYMNKNDIDIAVVGKLLHFHTCSVDAQTIKLESTTGQVIQMFEVQVFSGGINIAQDGKASSSSRHKMLSAEKAIDGDMSTFSHTSLDDLHAWWQLDLNRVRSFDRLIIFNRWCQSPKDEPSCLCRLSYAKLSFMDESGGVKTISLGDTCNTPELEIDLTTCEEPSVTNDENTEVEEWALVVDTYEPTYFPSKEPTYLPTKGPLGSETVDEDSEPNSLPIATSSNSNIKQLQIANYIAGSALILSIHITHHAGTSVCAKMSECGPTPSFACMKNKQNDGTPWPEHDPKLDRFGLTYNDAQVLVTTFRPYFHFMSMEYPRWGNLHNMNWEYPTLVSMIVMRNPLDRFLGGGKCGRFHNSIINESDPDPENPEVQRLYWEYANDNCADNYALRVLAEKPRCDASSMEECFQSAKSLLERFTFVLDEECLDESMEAMGNQLGLQITADGFESRKHHYHATARERINNETLYEFLMEKFHYDVALYEWSKNMSVVRCSDLVFDSLEPTYFPSKNPIELAQGNATYSINADTDTTLEIGGDAVEVVASVEPTYVPSLSPVHG